MHVYLSRGKPVSSAEELSRLRDLCVYRELTGGVETSAAPDLIAYGHDAYCLQLSVITILRLDQCNARFEQKFTH